MFLLAQWLRFPWSGLENGQVKLERTLMIWLIFAHFIGDWAMQPEWVALNKGKYWFIMFAHCMVWTACISVALEYLGIFSLWKVGFLFIGHYLIDLWKCGVYAKKPFCQQVSYWHLYEDQLLHILQCISCGF